MSARPQHAVHDSSPGAADRRSGLTRRELTRRALLIGGLLAVDPSLVGSSAVAADAPGAPAATFTALVDALEPAGAGPAALDRASDVFAAAYSSWDPAVRSFADETLAAQAQGDPDHPPLPALGKRHPVTSEPGRRSRH